jgi:hypothetical protein
MGAIMLVNAICMSAALTAMVAWRSFAAVGSAVRRHLLIAAVLAGAFLRAAERGIERIPNPKTFEARGDGLPAGDTFDIYGG